MGRERTKASTPAIGNEQLSGAVQTDRSRSLQEADSSQPPKVRAPFSINPSWRCVQGDMSQYGQARNSLSEEEIAQVLRGDACVGGDADVTDGETREKESEGTGRGGSPWFPNLRRVGLSSITNRGMSAVRNLMKPEGVRLHNQGVQAGESFVAALKGGVNRPDPEGLDLIVTKVDEKLGGDSHQGGPSVNGFQSVRKQEVADTKQASISGLGGQNAGQMKPPLEPEIGLGGQSAGQIEPPFERETSTSSSGSSGFVRRLEIEIGENGEIKAEEVWQDAMPSPAGVPMARTGSEFRRQLSKIPSDIMPKSEGKVCVLAIDGGGVRGLIPALMLARLERMLQEKSGNSDVRIADYFDLIAGTSVGGLLAIMLLCPNEEGRPLFTAPEAVNFIKDNAPRIFYKHWAASVRQVFKPKYSTKPLERILDYYLDTPWETPLTLKHLLKPCLITSYDLSRASPRFFVRRLAQLSDTHDFTLRDVCRATAAAPTFFKPAKIVSRDKSSTYVCADGAIVANNPTLAAVNHLLVNQDEFPRSSLTRPRLVLSLGAGEAVEGYEYKQARKWGLLGWAVPVVEMMLWGNGNTVDFIMTLFSEALSTAKSYLRIEVKHLTGSTKNLDDASPSNMAAIEKLAEEALASKAVTLDKYGFAQELDQTYEERLDEFADELIAEHDARAQRRVPTVRIAPPAPAHLRADMQGKKVEKKGLPEGRHPVNPADTY